MTVKLVAKELSVGLLRIDPAYQRMVVPNQVKWIVTHYDEVAFGRILVGDRGEQVGGNNDSFWVVDGQQRLTAAREMEMNRVPCLVFKSDGRKHEATVFKQINADRAGVRPIDVFKALLEAREPEAVVINATVEECGFRIHNASRSEFSWNTVQAIVAVRNIFKKGGPDLIRKTLDTVKKCWEGDPQAVNGLILGGVAHFLLKAEFVEYSYDRLITKLNAHKPMELARYVADVGKIMGGGRNRDLTMAGAILSLYNKGLRNKLSVPGLNTPVVPAEEENEKLE